MKSRIPLLLMLVVFAAVASPARADSVVGFRYQGSLNDGASPATGFYDLSFALCDASSNGLVIGSLTNSGTVVSNGLFSAALAFPTSFNGTNYWLEIAARTNGNGPFTTLSPRQQLMPVPQAIYASHAGTATTAMTASNANSLSAANLVGTLSTAQLPANVALLNAANTFSGHQTVSGAVGIGVAASPSTVLHVVSPNPNARILFESSVPNGNPALIVKANSPAGEADIVADRADTGASAALNLLMGGAMEWTLRTPNFTSGEPTRLDLGNAASIPVMTFRQNGNVGIGRTSPATALDVNGTVTATGFSGNLSGGTSLPLTGLQSGGAANAQILTWNGSRWSPSNAPAGGASGLSITATNLSATTSQSLLVAAGNGTGNGGSLSLNAGNAGVTSGGAGGNLNLQSGSAVPQGGSGYSGQGPAGIVNISAGGGYNGVGGNVILRSGPNSPWSLTPNGYSKVSLQGGALNAGDGAVIDVEGGHNPLSNGSGVSAGGNVKITAGNAAGAYAGGHILLLPGTGSPGGNVGIGKTSPATALDVNGTVTATAFSPSSDRHLKENFAPVSPRDVLDKVAAMPISRWNFIGDAATPHFGPMAQDFHAAFGLGTDERHIATVDADGVALAAIQGLNQKLNEKDAEIQDLKRSLADLKNLVRALVEKK